MAYTLYYIAFNHVPANLILMDGQFINKHAVDFSLIWSSNPFMFVTQTNKKKVALYGNGFKYRRCQISDTELTFKYVWATALTFDISYVILK